MTVSEHDAAWQQLGGIFEEVFGKAWVYRTLEGKTFDITASVVSHRQQSRTDRDVVLTTWQGRVFTLKRSLLVDNGIEYPRNGEEICEEAATDLWHIYRITPPPKGKTYESDDPEDFQIDVFAVQIASRSYA